MSAGRRGLPPESHPHHPFDQNLRQQVTKILASPEFQRSSLLRDFLRFIVDKTLAGEAHEIKGYTVAVQVLQRGADFDPGRDPIVRILAGRLRRALERYYLTEGRQDRVRIDIPKGTYVPVFQVNVPEPPAPAPLPVPPVADALFHLPQGPSVAVMPLLNLTSDPKQEIFAEGLAEELTGELAGYQDLRVIAYQSTRKWKGEKADAREVGRDLGVRFLLGGSIRKDSKTLKIDLYVVDAQNGRRIWGRQYGAELRADRLIALQEEISREVVGRIGNNYGIIPQTLSRESRRKALESLETYEAFLRFYDHIAVLSPQTFAETLQVLEAAARREPESSPAWSFLSFLYGQSYALHLAPLPAPLEAAAAAARRSVALEPENQMAHTALAQVHFFRNEPEKFRAEAETALNLNPNAPVPVGFLGWLMALSGDWERGLTVLYKGMALNPHFPGWFHVAPCFYLLLQDRVEEAYQEALAFQMPQLFWDPLLRAATLGRLGRKTAGARALAQLLALRPDFPDQGPFLISCLAKSPALRDALLAGLRTSGLTL
jgi:adenylate cyclase